MTFGDHGSTLEEQFEVVESNRKFVIYIFYDSTYSY
jgi:hypothetical protein